MAFIFNGTNVKGVNFNGTTVKKVIYNGEVVFTADREIYKNGVLADGVTLSNFTNQNNTLNSSNVAPAQYEGGAEARKTCTITFDVTDFSTITVKLDTSCYGYDQNTYERKIGLDTANETLTGGYRGGWGTEGSPASYTKTYDVSNLTGNHSIVVDFYNKNLSDYYTCVSEIFIKEIMAYS